MTGLSRVSTNPNPPPDNTYGPMIDTGQALGNDSPFGPGASSSTAGYIANGPTGQVVEGSDLIVGEWFVKNLRVERTVRCYL